MQIIISHGGTENAVEKRMNARARNGTSFPEARGRKARPALSITDCFTLIGLFWIMLLMADRALAWPASARFIGTLPGQAALVVFWAFAGALGWRCRSWLYGVLTSVPFAVSVLGWVLAFVVLGTLILQGEPSRSFARVYGEVPSLLILGLGLNDIFHSIWFGGLLALLALSLVLVVIKKRAWRMSRWGHLLAHGGVVVIIAGGLTGYFFGKKGHVDLHEGGEASRARETRLGVKTESSFPLGFSLLLEDFEIKRREAAVFGIVALTLGLVMGAVWGKFAWGDYWSWDPKENWALVTFLAYMIYLHLRLSPGWKGKRAMWVLVFAFAAVVFTYLGMNVLPTAGESLHVYQ